MNEYNSKCQYCEDTGISTVFNWRTQQARLFSCRCDKGFMSRQLFDKMPWPLGEWSVVAAKKPMCQSSYETEHVDNYVSDVIKNGGKFDLCMDVKYLRPK